MPATRCELGPRYPDNRNLQQPWRTAIVQTDETPIRIRGYDLTQLMQRASCVDNVFLLHRGRLPNAPERRLLDAVLTASADHGSGVHFMEAVDAAIRESGKALPVNIDGSLGALLYDLGFPPEAGKLIFIVGRVAGLTAEVAEEYAREKPMRIHIPVEYDGEPPRELE